MKDLLCREAITNSLTAESKEEAIEELATLLYKAKKITSLNKFTKEVKEREKLIPTSLENGVMIPHAKSKFVNDTSIAIGIKYNGIKDKDSKTSIKIVVLIASKENENKEHLRALSTITSKLLDEKILQRLIDSQSDHEIYDLLINDNQNIQREDMFSKGTPFFIGVTGCPVGVAHTYLAASSLIKEAENRGVSIKVETNGSIGVENSPTLEEIKKLRQ